MTNEQKDKMRTIINRYIDLQNELNSISTAIDKLVEKKDIILLELKSIQSDEKLFIEENFPPNVQILDIIHELKGIKV